jgi:hypothetical protein
MKTLLIFVLLLAWGGVSAQSAPLVYTCPHDWGSKSCNTTNGGGCSDPVWLAPGDVKGQKVWADAKDFYTPLKDLALTDLVAVSTSAKAGDTATCATTTAHVAASTLISTPVPPPAPIPGPSVVDLVISWDPCLLSVDGSPCDPTGYKILYGLGAPLTSVLVGKVLAFTIKAPPPGTYEVRLTSLNSSGESNPSNPAFVKITGVVTPPTSPPVNCVVSDWSAWNSNEPWSICSAGQQSRMETRTRTVLTPPANGGAACGVLTETRLVTQACIVPPPPGVQELCLVDGISEGIRPIYLPSATNTRGKKVGDLSVGPVSQPVGTMSPFKREACSCTQLRSWSGTVYSWVSHDGINGYVAGCKTYGFR